MSGQKIIAVVGATVERRRSASCHVEVTTVTLLRARLHGRPGQANPPS